MNKPTSQPMAMAARMRLQSQLIGHIADRARINPAAPASGIRAAQVSAKMLSVINELGADNR